MKILERFLRLWTPKKVEIVKRGFASSIDEIPNYKVWWDGERYSFDLTCICGLTYPISPREPQFHWSHHAPICGWDTDITLDGWNEWLGRKR